MKRQDLQFVLDVLQDKLDIRYCNLDWYSIIGFLEMHKVVGSFYHSARKLSIELPQQVFTKIKKHGIYPNKEK